MAVQITDWAVDLVRAYVRQDSETVASMLPKRTQSTEIDEAALMMRAAFVEAVHRRFAGRTRADVIRFVAHARIRRGRNAPPIHTAAAEQLIIAALTGTATEGLTDLQRAQHIILLSELIEDEQPDDDELEAFLTDARAYAEQLAATL